ncbi:MAG: hypothetical protein D6780_01650, partial [Candidatus Dadabacteria bacterium]
AITVKGKLPTDASKATLLAVVSNGGVASQSTDTSSKSNFKLKVSGKDARLLFTIKNKSVPVLWAVLKGKKVLPVKKAIKKKICGNQNVFGLTVIKKNVKGKKQKILFTVVSSSEGDPSYVYVKRIKNGKNKNKKLKLKKLVDKSVKVSLNSDCSPLGNALTLGLVRNSSSARVLASSPGDADSDGMPDEVDVDVDNDGVMNNYDTDYSTPANSFMIFTNLKVSMPETLNTHVLPSVSTDDIDTLLQTHQTMAIEVKGDEDSGDTSELDCGTLNYCSAGGTGKKLEDGSDFPGTAGGANDSDGDGLGEITKGSTNDFQLQTGASSSDISAGDTITQIVTTSDGKETTYTASLQFVFYSTPAVKSIVFNEGDASEKTFTPTYPVSEGDEGTTSNPIQVSADASGNITMKITVYRPQRPGITAAGEASVMDIGNSLISIDIPNAPSDGSSSGNGPGGCPVTSYTESDPDLEISGEKLQDTAGDYDSSSTDSDGNTTVTFTVDLTSCLASASETFDVGEKVSLDIAFSSTAGDNAAQKIWLERTS